MLAPCLCSISVPKEALTPVQALLSSANSGLCSGSLSEVLLSHSPSHLQPWTVLASLAHLQHICWYVLAQAADLLLQGDGDIKRREDLRRRQQMPTSTLFVVNFDVEKTRERDLERHFEEYGRLKRVQIKRNYAFVQFETIDQAGDAVKGTHLHDFMGAAVQISMIC